MIKTIKRKTDGKYLQSIENDIWVIFSSDAFEMTYKECEVVKEILFKTYSPEEIVEIVNLLKHKPITKDEKKELRDLLRK